MLSRLKDGGWHLLHLVLLGAGILEFWAVPLGFSLRGSWCAAAQPGKGPDPLCAIAVPQKPLQAALKGKSVFWVGIKECHGVAKALKAP